MSLAYQSISGTAIAGQSPAPPSVPKGPPGKRTIVSRPDVIDQPEPR